MSEGSLEYAISMSFDDVFSSAKQAQAEVDEVASNAQRVFFAISSNARRALRSLRGLVSAMRGIANVMGIEIPEIYNILLRGVSAAAGSLMAIGIAWAPAPGIGQIIFMLLAAASLGLIIGETASLMMGRDSNKTQIDGMLQTLKGLESAVGPWAGISTFMPMK